ncbi:YncE family protein [Mycobacterium kansasii]
MTTPPPTPPTPPTPPPPGRYPDTEFLINSPASSPAASTGIRSAISPLRWIVWGALICLVDLTYSQTVNGVGWRFDFANDAVGMLMILWGTSRLAKIRVHDRYRSALRFVIIAAVFSLLDAIHGHFIYATPAAVALFFSLVGVASMIANVVFCVAMRWLSEEAGLQRSAKSWKVTTWLFVIIYLIPVGSLSCAAAIATALGSPFHVDLGPAALLLLPVFGIPLIHFFVSTTRMKTDAESPSPAPPPQPPQPRLESSRTTRRRLLRVLAIAGALAVVGIFVLLYYRSQSTNPVKATVHVGQGPYAVAVDPGTHTVYTANYEDNTVSVIDGKTRTVTATVPVGKKPVSVAVDPGTHTVYVAALEDRTVSVIDGSTNTVTATLRDPRGQGARSVAVDPGTHTVYVAYLPGSVSVFDGKTHTVTTRVDVGSRAIGVAADPGTHTVYVAALEDRTVSVIDGSTNSVTATVKVRGGFSDVNPIAVDPNTHTVYLANLGDDTVSVIDGSTNTVTSTVVGVAQPNGVAVDPGTRKVFVVTRMDKMSVIDGSTNKVTATFPVGSWPGAVAVDPGTHTVYVANTAEHTVSVIEGL